MWGIATTQCILSVCICIYHAREMLATGRVGDADPGPQPIAADKENILPFGAPEIPTGYIFTEWLR